MDFEQKDTENRLQTIQEGKFNRFQKAWWEKGMNTKLSKPIAKRQNAYLYLKKMIHLWKKKKVKKKEVAET